MINISNIKFKITNTANKKINQLIQHNKNKKIKFRIYIIGGGCNGFQYQFKMDNTMNNNDLIINNKYNIIIDSISVQYLNGGIIDYQKTLEGEKFIISNPNAKTTCSCGSSFSI